MFKKQSEKFKELKEEFFIAGKCFICGEECKKTHYCHFVCAEAYYEKIKELRGKSKE